MFLAACWPVLTVSAVVESSPTELLSDWVSEAGEEERSVVR